MKKTKKMKTATTDDLIQKAINTVRILSADAVQKANSGHPGTPMALAPLGHLLWTEVMKYNPKNPDWPNRDRFILSCGHACMLQYSFLFLTGYEISIEDIKNFRQLHSITAGHPEYGLMPGIEITTGPLGQGFANGVGMAIEQNTWQPATTGPATRFLIIKSMPSAATEILWKEYLLKLLPWQAT